VIAASGLDAIARCIDLEEARVKRGVEITRLEGNTGWPGIEILLLGRSAQPAPAAGYSHPRTGLWSWPERLSERNGIRRREHEILR
jgi:hypothetical protein